MRHTTKPSWNLVSGLTSQMDEKWPLLQFKTRPKTVCRLPCRYVLVILTFWGLSVTYSLRVNLSIAMVAMVNSTYANPNAESMETPDCTKNKNNYTRFKVDYESINRWFVFYYYFFLNKISFPKCRVIGRCPY